MRLRARVARLEASVRPAAVATTPDDLTDVERQKLSTGFLQLGEHLGGPARAGLAAVADRLKAGEPLGAALEAADEETLELLIEWRDKLLGEQ